MDLARSAMPQKNKLTLTLLITPVKVNMKLFSDWLHGSRVKCHLRMYLGIPCENSHHTDSEAMLLDFFIVRLWTKKNRIRCSISSVIFTEYTYQAARLLFSNLSFMIKCNSFTALVSWQKWAFTGILTKKSNYITIDYRQRFRNNCVYIWSKLICCYFIVLEIYLSWPYASRR